MVKGMTRRVVVVKSPDKRMFEEAVFFLCDDAEHGVSSAQIVAEAQSIANDFTRDSLKSPDRVWLKPALFSAMGAVLASLCWAIAVFLF